MKLNRIARSKSHGIFKDYSWPADLEPFDRFNLVYGWNGTGKTTLSNLRRCPGLASAANVATEATTCQNRRRSKLTRFEGSAKERL